jgi:glutathione peroxidase
MTLFDYSVLDSNQEIKHLSDYRGHVTLVVNTAIHCGLAPQYKALEALYQMYHKDGFDILDFPCNQFGDQSPEDDKETEHICEVKLKNSFKPFAKVDVNGKHTAPVYQFLKKSKNPLFGRRIKWNFTKFLVNKDGKVVRRYGPIVDPIRIKKDIERLLK